MAYSITFKKSVEKDLKRLGKQHSEHILDRIDAELTEDPDRFPVLTGTFAGLRKFRVGDYRVVFAVIDHDVLVLRIQHRKDVYRG